MVSTQVIITKSDFAPYREVSQYLTDDKINDYILSAQDSFLRPILGTTLYKSLQDYIEANKTPIDADLDNLLFYVVPFLVYRSYASYLPYSGIFSRNMGMRILSEANSVPVTGDRINIMVQDAINLAKSRERDLRDFLCNNSDTYDWDGCTSSKMSYTTKISSIGKKPIDHVKRPKGWPNNRYQP